MKYKNLLLVAALGFGASAAFLYVFYVAPNDRSIGIIGIAFTIGVGFLIYFLQGKTDKEVKKAVDRIDRHTEQIRGFRAVKSYHDELRNLNERITKGSLSYIPPT